MKRDKRRVAFLVSLAVVLLLFGWLTLVVYRALQKVGGTPQDFKAFIENFGVSGWLVGFFLQCLQVFVALIPGELVEIGLGAAFGAVGGTLLCLAGVAAASSLVFFVVKKYGVRFVELFFEREKIDQLAFINSEKKLDAVVFLLFFIPGTPKDLLTYFVGLTRMRLPRFLCVSLLARIPSVVSSTVGGNLLAEKNYFFATILFVVTGGVSLLGMLLYNRFVKYKSFTRITKKTERVLRLFLKICSIPLK